MVVELPRRSSFDLVPPPSPRGTADVDAKAVLDAVDEVLALDGTARTVALDAMSIWAQAVTRLASEEAALLFDRMVGGDGERGWSVDQMRRGREAAGRFADAYRTMVHRRIAEEVFTAVGHVPSQLEPVPYLSLGEDALARLGAARTRAELEARALGDDPGAARALAWHLFAAGPESSLLGLDARIVGALDPRAEALVEWVRLRDTSPQDGGSVDHAELEAAIAAAHPFALGEVLLVESSLSGLRADEGSGVAIDGVARTLHRLVGLAPEADADPLASALAFYRRGVLEAALPSVLGWRPRGLADLRRAIEVAIAPVSQLDRAARARLEGNARLAMARVAAAAGQDEERRAHLERATAIDPGGPIGRAAHEALEAKGSKVVRRKHA